MVVNTLGQVIFYSSLEANYMSLKAELEKAIEMEEEASPVERCMAIIAEGKFGVRLLLSCLLNG